MPANYFLTIFDAFNKLHLGGFYMFNFGIFNSIRCAVLYKHKSRKQTRSRAGSRVAPDTTGPMVLILDGNSEGK